MNKQQIQDGLDAMPEYLPIRQIEVLLKMPATTLQKVLKGDRELPKKWDKVLANYFLSAIVDEKPKDWQQKHEKNKRQEEFKAAVGKHPLYKEGDPKEDSGAFHLKYGCWNYEELEANNQ